MLIKKFDPPEPPCCFVELANPRGHSASATWTKGDAYIIQTCKGSLRHKCKWTTTRITDARTTNRARTPRSEPTISHATILTTSPEGPYWYLANVGPFLHAKCGSRTSGFVPRHPRIKADLRHARRASSVRYRGFKERHC